MRTKIFLTGLALIAITAFAAAQDPAVAGNGRGNGICNGSGKGPAFVDKDKNGVCDNFENRKAGNATNLGKGNCPGSGSGIGQGKGQSGDQSGDQGQGPGKGQGKNFVDANGNGICDHFEVRAKK